MSVKSVLSLPFARLTRSRIRAWNKDSLHNQEVLLLKLLKKGSDTAFGKDYHFNEIQTYDDFKYRVPINDYEDLRPYMERIKSGEKNILWPGQPLYLSKTSGTTSGIKYINITRESISCQISGARNALLMYIAETGNSKFVDGNMIFLSGSPELEKISGISTGRLSGIVNHHIPGYLRRNQMPSFETNCIEDWEEKVDKIVEETFNKNMTLVSGIPPWVQMYFDRLINKTGKKVKELFPNFTVFVHGGVNYEPYKSKLNTSIGGEVDAIEVYPASEGFIAFQDTRTEEGLLLMLESGIYYEFIPASEYFTPNPPRLNLSEVELGVNYAIILTTNAGLWAYSLGDTVRFTSLDPHRIVVTGRVKHFISAFGEHVIAEEVDRAVIEACRLTGAEIVELTVAPQVSPSSGLPYHEWFIEFSRLPSDLQHFTQKLEEEMQRQNIYYRDLIAGKVLQSLKVIQLKPDAFISYMRGIGKLGGQNKMPRLANDRKIAVDLIKFAI